jgi:hypothetical protein
VCCLIAVGDINKSPSKASELSYLGSSEEAASAEAVNTAAAIYPDQVTAKNPPVDEGILKEVRYVMHGAILIVQILNFPSSILCYMHGHFFFFCALFLFPWSSSPLLSLSFSLSELDSFASEESSFSRYSF